MTQWIEDGFVRESTAKGPKGQPFKILALTPKGANTARDLVAKQDLDPGQQIESSLLQRSQLVHDTAIYRACGRERQRLLEQGATLRRVRLDAELRSTVASRSETARVRDGRQAADAERHRAARELGLPIDDHGRVHYPDAQLEYTAEDGRTGRVNVEVASGHYSASTIRAKANVTWNTVYMNAAIERLRAEGRIGRDIDLGHLSPALYGHVNPYAKYRFEIEARSSAKSPTPKESGKRRLAGAFAPLLSEPRIRRLILE